MLSSDIIFCQCVPNHCAFICAASVIICLTINFCYYCGINWVQRIETLWIKLYRWHCITAIWSNVWHYYFASLIKIFFELSYINKFSFINSFPFQSLWNSILTLFFAFRLKKIILCCLLNPIYLNKNLVFLPINGLSNIN